jgi:hypothetical protein
MSANAHVVQRIAVIEGFNGRFINIPFEDFPRGHCELSINLRSKFLRDYGVDLQVGMAVQIVGEFVKNISSDPSDENDTYKTFRIHSIVRPKDPVLVVTGNQKVDEIAKRLVKDVLILRMYSSLDSQIAKATYSTLVKDLKNYFVWTISTNPELFEEMLSKLLEDVRVELLEEQKREPSQAILRKEFECSGYMGFIREVNSRHFKLQTAESLLKFKINQHVREGFRKLYGTDFQVNQALVITCKKEDDEYESILDVKNIAQPTTPMLLISLLINDGNKNAEFANSIRRRTGLHVIMEQYYDTNYAELIYHSPGKRSVGWDVNSDALDEELENLLRYDQDQLVSCTRITNPMGIIRKVTSNSFTLETKYSEIGFIVTQSICEDFRKLYGEDLKMNMAVVITCGHQNRKGFEVKNIERPAIPILFVSGNEKIYSEMEKVIIGKNDIHVIKNQCYFANHVEIVYNAPNKNPVVCNVITQEQFRSVLTEILS